MSMKTILIPADLDVLPNCPKSLNVVDCRANATAPPNMCNIGAAEGPNMDRIGGRAHEIATTRKDSAGLRGAPAGSCTSGYAATK
jgi:hypothetical protein